MKFYGKNWELLPLNAPRFSWTTIVLSMLICAPAWAQNGSNSTDRLALVGPQSPAKPNVPQSELPVRHITLVLVGDTGYAPHRATPHPKGVAKHGRWLRYNQTTQHIASEINGDINFANIEAVITDRRLRAMPKAFNFATHSNGARHLVKTGFNLFSLANNHSFDHGTAGIRDSLKHAESLLDDGLLAHAGIGENRAQAGRTPVFAIGTTKFAFGSIGIGASGGGIQRASKKRPGQLSLYNKSDLSLLSQNLSQANADFRLLSIHRGPERHIRPSKGEIRSVRALVEKSDADIMIGHHAHVTRGIEMMGDRLIVYGLGNFLHQGTANMAGKSGCQDYSIIVRVHLVQQGEKKPQIAAVEVVPITQTHVQTKRLAPRQAARRVAVLNGLARQFDNTGTGSRGIRFAVRTDGTGLYCTPVSNLDPATRALCSAYTPQAIAFDRTYRSALNRCGKINPAPLLASLRNPQFASLSTADKVILPKSPAKPIARPNQKANLAAVDFKEVKDVQSLRGSLSNLTKKPEMAIRAQPKPVTKATKLVANPETWPRGMPLAWLVPSDESYVQKRARWAKKRYSIEEVEKLLIKRGLLDLKDATHRAAQR